jgi:glycerol-3-phosphate acyltransferase PlsY
VRCGNPLVGAGRGVVEPRYVEVSKARAAMATGAGFALGAVPFSNLAARWCAGVDLRSVGAGTVSGTGLARVAGNRAVVVAGLFELAKGAAGPALAGRRHPAAALAGAAAVAGHNWSPLLGWAGGRGVSPAMGALLVTAPAGSLVLATGLALGRLGGETALGCLAAYVLLVPVAARAHGRAGRRAALAVLLPVLAKRMMGNSAPAAGGASVYLWRLLFDRDTRAR